MFNHNSWSRITQRPYFGYLWKCGHYGWACEKVCTFSFPPKLGKFRLKRVNFPKLSHKAYTNKGPLIFLAHVHPTWGQVPPPCIHVYLPIITMVDESQVVKLLSWWRFNTMKWSESSGVLMQMQRCDCLFSLFLFCVLLCCCELLPTWLQCQDLCNWTALYILAESAQ